MNRVVLYGHHESNVRIDPDEIRLLREVSRAAAIPYISIDLEDTAKATEKPLAAAARAQSS